MARWFPCGSRILLTLLCLVSSWRAFAQEQPAETLPGFKPNNVLESHGIDNVNIFSGDPGIVVPLGPVYPLGPSNSWQLKAYYSAKLWLFDNDDCTTDTPPTTGVRHAYIRGYPTIGAGWTLGVGYVSSGADSDDVAAAGYYSPDGAKHSFKSSSGSPPFITTDGTHLRVTPYPATGTPSYYTVEFPDGTVQTFGHQFLRPRPISGSSSDFTDVTWNWKTANVARYGLSSIQDAYGTVLLTVDYVSNVLDNNSWKILHVNLNPGTAQARQIGFNWGAAQGGMWDAVGSISFPTANGTLTASFGYNFPMSPAAVVNRNGYDNSATVSSSCRTGGIAQVHLLSAVTLSAPSITTLSYGFSYQLDLPSAPNGTLDGVLAHVSLPTTGTIDYAYGATIPGASGYCFLLPSGTCPDPETGGTVSNTGQSAPCSLGPLGHGFAKKFWDASAAVVSRTVTDPITGATPSVTSYSRTQLVPEYVTSSTVPDDCGVIRSVLVTRPSGTGSGQFVTRHLFHVAVDPGEGGGVELERRTYAGSDASPTGQVVRTVVNCYENDLRPPTCGFHDSTGKLSDFGGASNPRLQASVTWFGANPSWGGACPVGASPGCTAKTSSNYVSAAGKYKVSVASDSLAATDSRTTTIDWTPCAPPNHTCAAADPWLLNLWDTRTDTDGTGTLYRYADFNSANGFLRGSLTWDSVNSRVLKDCRYPDGAGNVDHSYTSTASGYSSPPPITLCPASMPSVGADGDSLGRQNSSVEGLLTSQRWINGTTATSTYLTFDATRDPVTGLITLSRDSAGVSTAYAYDSLNRLTCIAPGFTVCPPPATPPPPETPTIISYDSATQTTVSRSGGSGLTTWQRYVYDGFGRLLREIRLMPYGAYAVRATAYDMASHISTKSEWTACGTPAACATAATPNQTTSSGFDALDRPSSVAKADGSTTLYTYVDGPRSTKSTRVQNVNGSCANRACTGGTEAKTDYTTDMFGRLTQVQEPSNTIPPTTLPPAVAYTYDLNDKLTFVSQGGVGGQTRTFTYDAFGFLRSEITPEKGTVTDTTVGSQGNVVSQRQNDGLVLTRSYDFAGHLTGVASSEGRTYVTNAYDAAGRLSTRQSTNFAQTPNTGVTDIFTYGGLNGRLSQQRTQIVGSLALDATQTWQHNSLGLIAHYYHPQVAGGVPRFVVSTAYDAGLPVNEYVNGIPAVRNASYQPSGTLASYITGLFPAGGSNPHSVLTTIAADSYVPRPAEIYAMDATTGARLFDTLAYGYDGAGNIVSMNAGSDRFQYDLLSRLTSATLAAAGSTQTYTFDVYGNMLTRGSKSFCSSTCANNRITGTGYDGRGNLTGSNTYTYDALDRMSSDSSTVLTTYVYDGAAERVAKVASSAWTVTLRDDAKRIASEFSSTTPSRDDVYLGNLLVSSYANLSVTGSDKAWSFYSSDHLGTPRLVTRLDGTSAATPTYWPFGEQVSAGDVQRIKFSTMEGDSEAGSGSDRYYDHARSLGSSLGRFLSPDQLEGKAIDPQSWNRYAYADNNPLRHVDPDGKDSILSEAWDWVVHHVIDKVIEKAEDKAQEIVQKKEEKIQPGQRGLIGDDSLDSSGGAGPLDKVGKKVLPKFADVIDRGTAIGADGAEALARNIQARSPSYTRQTYTEIDEAADNNQDNSINDIDLQKKWEEQRQQAGKKGQQCAGQDKQGQPCAK
jgi:RHS repeat-associated protein